MCVGALSYSSDLVSDMNTDVQRIMMSDKYRVLFSKSELDNKFENGIAVKCNSDEFDIANHKGRDFRAGNPIHKVMVTIMNVTKSQILLRKILNVKK